MFTNVLETIKEKYPNPEQLGLIVYAWKEGIGWIKFINNFELTEKNIQLIKYMGFTAISISIKGNLNNTADFKI